MTVEIRSLFQARCDNRQITSRSGPNPTDWVSAALPDSGKALSFHFFVNWTLRPPQVSGSLWFTSLAFASSLEALNSTSNVDVLKAFQESGAFQYLSDLAKLGNRLNLPTEAMLLGETSQGTTTGDSPVWRVSLTNEPNEHLKIERLSVNELSAIICEIRGGQANLGSKGLTFGTSAVECYLSKTRNIFPGDCDCLILLDGNPVAVLEMKKHTLGNPIRDNLASKYYPLPDGRKYDALFALQDKFRKEIGVIVPVAVIYYATKFDGLRVQVIEKRTGALFATKDSGDICRGNLTQRELGEVIIRTIQS